ncbi:MAG: hypothetical protein DMG38_02985 [Acidobacteria bacterium]|nr:MAG: hypothetical protein DMG38_02985 [Acidobacteriota bacterium]
MESLFGIFKIIAEIRAKAMRCAGFSPQRVCPARESVSMNLWHIGKPNIGKEIFVKPGGAPPRNPH